MWYRWAQKFMPGGQGWFDFSDSGIKNPTIPYDKVIFTNDGVRLRAYYNGEELGNIYYCYLHGGEHVKSSLYIEYVNVNPLYRKMGIGDILYTRLRQFCKDKNIKVIEGSIHHPSTLNLRFKHFGMPKSIFDYDSGKQMSINEDSYYSILSELRRRVDDPSVKKFDNGMPYGRGWLVKHEIED